MNLSKASRYLVGAPIFSLGLAIIIAEMLRFYAKNVEVHVIHLVLGFVFMYIGGFIINSVLAESIADNLIDKLGPLLNRIPGGRRKTDPPPSADDEGPQT